MEWLTSFILVAVVWVGVYTEAIVSCCIKDNRTLILASPLLALIGFGVYSVLLLIYRVANFNDCDEAAAELKEQIKEAKDDLTKRGLKLKSH